jgi:hypothetical protein
MTETTARAGGPGAHPRRPALSGHVPDLAAQ